MNCYLCKNDFFTQIKNRVRDREDVKVLKCNSCGLVFLDSTEHIHENFYEENQMNKAFCVGNIAGSTDIADTDKRFNLHKSIFTGRRILDFGCGKGSLLKKIKDSGISKELYAFEPNTGWHGFLKDFEIYNEIQEIPDDSLDVITLFHVLEHIKDPAEVLNLLYSKLKISGKMIIEVPSSDDALLNLYNCSAFSDFSYWSCHLYLFNAKTLNDLFCKTQYKINCINQYQRYTLANHLHWLAKGQPAGHLEWAFLDDEVLQDRYEKKLAQIGQCDSLVAILEKSDIGIN